MGKVNVYLPDDLERSVRDAGLSASPICQTALRAALDRFGALRNEGRGSFTPRLDEVLDRKACATHAAEQILPAMQKLQSSFFTMPAA